MFNLCLLLLPLAGAAAIFTIARDHLYDYEYNDQGARALRGRVERLNADLIQIDFDRRQQWDNLVAGELMDHDIAAARGFLLSGRSMLASRDANQINGRSHGGSNDAEVEDAAMALLTPGTRARYEATVPLLSRRAASGQAQARPLEVAPPLGDQRDFELLARATLSDGDADSVQFVLTGLGLGLGGEFTPRMRLGATVLLEAARRPDYPTGLSGEMSDLIGAAVPIAAFRTSALARTRGEAGAYDNAAAAFRAAVSPDRAAETKRMLDMIGEVAEATTPSGAAALLTHASTLNDLPRLRLIALAAGDRAVAAAKRLPRDGQLIASARGELTLTRDLSAALGVAFLSLLVLIFLAGWEAYRAARGFWENRHEGSITGGELIDTFSQPWRGL